MPSHRSPDDAKIKYKMVYASSKSVLRKTLVGITAEVQATERDEVSIESGLSLSRFLGQSCNLILGCISRFPFQ
jgi:hypothetical protein